MNTARPREWALAHSACHVGIVEVWNPVPKPATAHQRRRKRRRKCVSVRAGRARLNVLRTKTADDVLAASPMASERRDLEGDTRGHNIRSGRDHFPPSEAVAEEEGKDGAACRYWSELDSSRGRPGTDTHRGSRRCRSRRRKPDKRTLCGNRRQLQLWRTRSNLPTLVAALDGSICQRERANELRTRDETGHDALVIPVSPVISL